MPSEQAPWYNTAEDIARVADATAAAKKENLRVVLPALGAFCILLLLGMMTHCAELQYKVEAEVAGKCIERGGSWLQGGACIGKEASK